MQSGFPYAFANAVPAKKEEKKKFSLRAIYWGTQPMTASHTAELMPSFLSSQWFPTFH